MAEEKTLSPQEQVALLADWTQQVETMRAKALALLDNYPVDILTGNVQSQISIQEANEQAEVLKTEYDSFCVGLGCESDLPAESFKSGYPLSLRHALLCFVEKSDDYLKAIDRLRRIAIDPAPSEPVKKKVPVNVRTSVFPQNW